MENKQPKEKLVSRPAVVTIVGHIDHGKTTLLDYIHKTSVAEGEVGGITQHLSAFTVTHKNSDGKDMEITFIDTPGHQSFTGMRERGLKAADIAVLVVSGEDSVKAQTKESIRQILESKTPFVVAITKSDKSSVNTEKVKADLAEAGVYVEGFGGQIPIASVSGKTGEGVDTLLDLILIVAEMENFSATVGDKAKGVVIESHRDQRRGIAATLIVKEGVLTSGMTIVAGNGVAKARIMEDFAGKSAKEISSGHAATVVGFSEMPGTGEEFSGFSDKKEAEEFLASVSSKTEKTPAEITDKFAIPIIIRADTQGTLEAIEKELAGLADEKVYFKIIQRGIGPVSEADIKLAGSDRSALVFGFRQKPDKLAKELALGTNIEIEVYDIIYKLIERLEEIRNERRPKETVEESVGKTKILKTFSRTKERQIVGGRVEEGTLAEDHKIKIIRRGNFIGEGRIVGLQAAKAKTREVPEGSECGIQIESKVEIATGDMLESITKVTR